MEDEFAELDDLDMDFELEGLEEAILEKDVIEFRQTLKQVAKSVEPQYTVEEIDNYLNNELGGEDSSSFPPKGQPVSTKENKNNKII